MKYGGVLLFLQDSNVEFSTIALNCGEGQFFSKIDFNFLRSPSTIASIKGVHPFSPTFNSIFSRALFISDSFNDASFNFWVLSTNFVWLVSGVVVTVGMAFGSPPKETYKSPIFLGARRMASFAN